MKDMTVMAFCRKFGACHEGKEWAYGLTEKRSKAMMSELWEVYHNNRTIEHFQFFKWAINCDGVFSESILRKMACRFVRETPLADGRKFWDMLTDERSRKAVIVSEKFADDLATAEELYAASAAARAAASAASAAASAAARAAAWAAASAASAAARGAWAATWGATWDAASAAALAAAQLQIIFEYGNPWRSGK